MAEACGILQASEDVTRMRHDSKSLCVISCNICDMKLVMDSDVLIKIAKASIKEVICSKFAVYVPSEVKAEAVDEGKVRGHTDALIIEENILRRKLSVEEAKESQTTERLITQLNLRGGEAGSLRLFKEGGYGAIASDDSKFVDLLEGLGIPFMTPGALLIRLLRHKQISESETLECLDKIRQFVSSEEYLASIEAVRREA